MAAKMAIIAMTTSNSIKVKPRDFMTLALLLQKIFAPHQRGNCFAGGAP
jgi:hypothetical protein